MTAKEYLLQVRALDTAIKRLDQEVARARSELTTLRSPWPDGQPHGSGGKSDPVATKAVQLADVIAKIEDEQLIARGRLWRTRAEVVETIGEVMDPLLQKILYGYYVDCHTFEQVAVDLGYSYRHITRMHGQALLAVAKVLEKR